MRSKVVFAAVLFAGLTVAAAASATPTFPGIVKEITGDPNFPPCTICHTDPNGGRGTATKPFAVYLKARHVVAFDEASLRTALNAAQAEPQGMPFFAALKQGLDPNPAQTVPPIDYGCGAHVTPRTGTPAAGPLLVLAVMLGAAARRRKAKKRAGRDRRQAAGT